MTARVLHVADLHVGRRDAEAPFAALRELTTRLSPTLVVATGDLAHRGRRSELERAAERQRPASVARARTVRGKRRV
ncbi:MAG TPA: metallophosphoesterase [Gaiellaceae bacterium]|nr:metallophosphoesterase [Gaiellaceae bacterium]